MVGPSPQVFESLARIGYSEKPLVDWITERLAEYQERMMFQADDVQMRILQGRAQELAEIRALIRKAPEILRKA